MTLIGPDGHGHLTEEFTITGAGDPIVLTNTWDGSDPPSGPQFADGNLWGTDVHDITSVLPFGQDSVQFQHVKAGSSTDDCIGIAAVVVEVPQVTG